MRTRYLVNSDGTSAVEFALVAVPFFALVFSIIWMGIVLYSWAELQHATEAASRCWSLGTGSTTGTLPCDGTFGDKTGGAQSYATSQYAGFGTPTFQIPSGFGAGCGHEIQGSVVIPINVVLFSESVTLNSQACFP